VIELLIFATILCACLSALALWSDRPSRCVACHGFLRDTEYRIHKECDS
jgi:hypothetical protein